MTWQGGKRGREAGPVSPFSKMTPFAGLQDDAAASLKSLAQVLRDFNSPVSINVRLVSGDDGESVEHWEVQGGAADATAQQKIPHSPNVILAMRPETLMQIAQGRLAPYDALFNGKIRIGGDVAMAKAITRHLSDPRYKYVAPC